MTLLKRETDTHTPTQAHTSTTQEPLEETGVKPQLKRRESVSVTFQGPKLQSCNV